VKLGIRLPFTGEQKGKITMAQNKFRVLGVEQETQNLAVRARRLYFPVILRGGTVLPLNYPIKLKQIIGEDGTVYYGIPPEIVDARTKQARERNYEALKKAVLEWAKLNLIPALESRGLTFAPQFIIMSPMLARG